ncbi:MAG: hypothetical protein ACRET8_00540 [Burkholderiales bacterium]
MIEGGLFRKKPCGHAAIAKCINCEQPLCLEHAIAQLTEGGSRTGKFMCQGCVDALKDHAKSMAAVARTQQARKMHALEESVKATIAAPPAPVVKKPVAPAAPAPAQAAPEAPKEPDALEFTPKDGKLEYTTKKTDPGFKPD